MTGFGRVVLQPSIGFGTRAKSGSGLRCKAYEVGCGAVVFVLGGLLFSLLCVILCCMLCVVLYR